MDGSSMSTRTTITAGSAGRPLQTTTISRWHAYPFLASSNGITNSPSQQHLNSRTHRGQHIQCPFCSGHYTTATGLAQHVETGSCPKASALNRDLLYKFVRSKDPSGIFTKNLIGWTNSVQYEANDRSYNWNRQGWECYLCHRTFAHLQNLNQHLNSPTRKWPLFRNSGCKHKS
jgi:hypothetical protein